MNFLKCKYQQIQKVKNINNKIKTKKISNFIEK